MLACRWLLLGAILLSSPACAPSAMDYSLAGWQPPVLGSSSQKGAIVVSLAFRTQGAETPMPSQVSVVQLRISSPTLDKPLEEWWRNPQTQQDAPTIRIEQLEPGTYTVELTLYDRGGKEFGKGFGEVTVKPKEIQRVRLLMSYQLGETMPAVSFEDVLPTGQQP